MHSQLRLGLTALVAGVALLVVLVTQAGGASMAIAETPTPPAATPTPLPFPALQQVNPPGEAICSAQGAYAGGQIVDALNLRVTLPPTGTYNVNSGVADPGGEFVRVCYVEGDAAIFLARDGTETGRRLSAMTPDEAAANRILNEVARGLKLTGPAPTPQPVCHAPAAVRGDGQRLLVVGGVAIVLPVGGDFALFIPTPGSDHVFTVCYVQGDARVSIDADDCREVSREARMQTANAVLDAISRSCTLPPTVGPFVTPVSQPSRAPIRPPETGDGGLIAQP